MSQIFSKQTSWFQTQFKDEATAELFSIESQLSLMLKIEAAWTRALGQVESEADTESRTQQIANKIENLDIPIDTLLQGVEQDGIPVPSLVREIKSHFEESDNPYIHKGLTSQDVMDTATMITLGEFSDIALTKLESISAELDKLKQAHGDKPLTAYTRMQAALQTTACTQIDNWQRPIKQVINELAESKTELNIIQWGGPIGDRDIGNKEAQDIENQDIETLHIENLGKAFAQQLGLNDPGFSWHTDRSVINKFANLLLRASNAIAKIGEDVALMAMIGQVQLSKGGSSSAMPHKNNPIKAEAITSLSAYINMLNSGLNTSAIQPSFRSGKTWTLELLIIPDYCQAVAANMNLVIELLSNIKGLGDNKK